MLEFTTTRHNPLIDPQLGVWSWEIPVYLFLGGLVAGMMILAGTAMLRLARRLGFSIAPDPDDQAIRLCQLQLGSD